MKKTEKPYSPYHKICNWDFLLREYHSPMVDIQSSPTKTNKEEYLKSLICVLLKRGYLKLHKFYMYIYIINVSATVRTGKEKLKLRKKTQKQNKKLKLKLL